MEIIENLYCVFDSVSGEFHHFTLATSDGLAVRKILSTLTCPLKDNTVVKLGKFDRCFEPDDISVSLNSCVFMALDDFEVVSWEKYKFPNDVADALSPLNLTSDELRDIIHNKASSSRKDVDVTEIYRKGDSLNG